MANKTHVPTDQELESATQVIRLICVDPDANNNKFWDGYALSDGTFYCEYGRVVKGRSGALHDYYDATALKGKSNVQHLESKAKSKMKGRSGKAPYVEQKVAAAPVGAAATSGKTVASSALKSIATAEIKGDSETKKLVGWLAEVNIHNITSNTNIAYDVTTGAFTTSLGTLVTDDGLVEARDLLTDLTPYVSDQDWEDTRFKALLAQYMQLIPQDVGRGRGWHETVLADDEALREQNDIIDALEAALTDSAKTTDGKKAKKKDAVFNVSLGVVSDAKIIAAIKKKYEKEKGNHGDVRGFKVKNVWTVEISTVRAAFQKHGKPLGNIKQLWHGTKASNLLSILKGGLVIPRSSAPHVCGRMFGDGLYFSDQSTKSIRYATGAWTGGGNTSRVFMFVCDVAMGKEHTPSGYKYGSFKIPSGYNSCFAKGGRSGVMNNEMIVYNTNQCDLVYLVEFGK